MVREIVGKLRPAKEEAKDKKKGGAKKAQPKKDGPPPKPIKWAESGPRHLKTTYHYMQEAQQDMSENIFPLNIRGDQGNPGIAPCIIKEVYFPPESPPEVATLIESALVYQNSGNYEMAIDCFEQAHDSWLKIMKHKDVKFLKKE